MPSDSPLLHPSVEWTCLGCSVLCIAVPSGRTQPLVPFLWAQPALTAFITVIISGLAEAGGGRTVGTLREPPRQGPWPLGSALLQTHTLSQQHWPWSLHWVEESARGTVC